MILYSKLHGTLPKKVRSLDPASGFLGCHEESDYFMQEGFKAGLPKSYAAIAENVSGM